MTLTYENKDLFTVEQGYYLAHCISADFALGAGIAKKFDELYNMRFKLRTFYPDYQTENFNMFDSLLVDNVFNIVTKHKCYHKPTYDSLRGALDMMLFEVEHLHVKKIAMPKIACGLDKLEWCKVEEMIQEVFKDTDVDILICVQ